MNNWELLAGNANRTAAQSNDKYGAMWLGLARALVTSGRWRWYRAGDGVASLSSLLPSDPWTGHSGVGFSSTWNSGTAWSISNIRAWWCLQEIDAEGAPTGRYLFCQRSQITSAGGDRLANLAMQIETPSGTPDYRSPYPSGTFRFLKGSTAWNNNGANWSGSDGTSTLDAAGASTLRWHIWTPSANAGNVGCFMVTPVNDTEHDTKPVLVYEALEQTAVADAHPFVVLAGGWHEVLGSSSEDGSPGFPANAYQTGSTWFGVQTVASTVAKDGTWQTASCVRYTTPDGISHPAPLSSTVIASDADSAYPILPALVFARTTAGTVETKGTCANLEMVFPVSNSQLYGVSVFADSLNANSAHYPRWLLGAFCTRAVLNSVATPLGMGSTSNSNAFRVLRPQAADPEVGDTTPPTATLVSPADGTLAKFEPVVIDIDDETAVRLYIVYVYYDYSAPAELVYVKGHNVLTNFTVTASVVADAQRLSIVRKGGWTLPPRLVVKVVDTSGNMLE